MNGYLLIFAFALLVCGYLVVRQARRRPAQAPVPARQPADSRELRAMKSLEGSIRLTPLGSDLKQKLEHEEKRQRPQEGRN